MKTIYLDYPLTFNEEQLQEQKPTVMALGYFDGVHLGHQSVINTAVKIAKEKGVTASVATLHPHPKEVLQRPQKKMRYITPLKDKIDKIASLGVDTLYVIRFSREFAKLTPQQFVDLYLIGLKAIHIVGGFDYTYGTLGKGTMETLPFHSRQMFDATTVEKYAKSDEKVSSTKIRELLANGEVAEVPSYLGDFYRTKGTVVHGEKRGRRIGFPTANIELNDLYIIPKIGVYAVSFKVHGKEYEGVCNVGFKPTFEQEAEELTIEVHLLSFDEMIYDEEVEIEWLQYIRPEQKFNGIDELIAQITKDKERARRYFQEQS